MNKELLLLILMVLPFFMSSCSDDDGKVDPMKWKTEVKASSDGYFMYLLREVRLCLNVQITVTSG